MTVNKILCVCSHDCLFVCMTVSWWSGVLRMTVYVLHFRLSTWVLGLWVFRGKF